MSIDVNVTVGELVAQDYRAASIFKQNGIDFCCGGNISIADSCKKKNINPEALVGALNDALSAQKEQSMDYNSWPLDLLADYIEKKHHRYVEEKIQEIVPYLDKVTNVHGDRHAELFEVNRLFKESADELTKHMKKEELIVFPQIRKMVSKQANGEIKPLAGAISELIKEHDNEGARFHRISELTSNYTVPDDACNTYRVTLALLNEFEDDLHTHIHLENNILFPKTAKLIESK